MRYLKTYEAWLDNKYDSEAETLDQVRSNDVEGEDEENKDENPEWIKMKREKK